MSFSRIAVLLLLIFSLAVMVSAPAWAAGQDISGMYEVKKTFYRTYVIIKHKGPKICLAAFIHTMFGSDYTYHFYGEVKGNKVTAKHPNGHTLTGTISKDGVLTGVVVTKDHHEYQIKAGPANRVTKWSDGKKRPSKCKL